MRNPEWAPFLAIESWVRRLLAEIGPSEDLRAALAQLLAALLGQVTSLESFVGGDLFRSLMRSLWDSYYCAVVLPERRPQDRPRLIFWIRFFRLLERLVNGEQAPALVAEFDRWQPMVPHLLARGSRKPAPTSLPAQPRFTERRAQIADLVTVTSGLRAAQKAIRQAIRRSDEPQRPPDRLRQPASELRIDSHA
jgi:hypothetical protein